MKVLVLVTTSVEVTVVDADGYTVLVTDNVLEMVVVFGTPCSVAV